MIDVVAERDYERDRDDGDERRPRAAEPLAPGRLSRTQSLMRSPAATRSRIVQRAAARDASPSTSAPSHLLRKLDASLGTDLDPDDRVDE